MEIPSNMPTNRAALKALHPDAPPVPEATMPPEPRPLVPRRVDAHVVSLADRDSYEAEQYRMLRYVLEEKRAPSGLGLVVAICSPAAGDGKSLTALNLAAALAQDVQTKVLLMDADLRRGSSSLKSYLGLGKSVNGLPGLCDAVLRGGVSLRDIARPLSGLNLSLVLTGADSPAPYEIFRSARFAALLAAARREYPYVILDAPPVVPLSDCRVIAKHVDGMLLVVAAHRTPRDMLEEALQLLGPQKLWGLVYNGGDLMPRRYYGYYGYAKPTAAKRHRSAPRNTSWRHGRQA